MKILIATEDRTYFLWQMLVQINNFIKYGYDKDTIYVVSSEAISPKLKQIMDNPLVKCKFYIYKDTRPLRGYKSSIRPHILEKFYTEHPEITKEPVLYMDPDVLFNKKLDFSDMLKDDTWYVSDTRSYIDSNYIKGKSDKLFADMCNIIGVSTNTIESLDDNAGGAQYLIKNIDAMFWRKCYYDMEALYAHMINTSNIYKPEHPIQAWCADMWTVLWNGVYYNHNISIHSSLGFSWATSPIEDLDKHYIFHNAGVVSQEGMFKKSQYSLKTPFKEELIVRDDNCSYYYYKELKDTINTFSEIIW